MKSNISRSKEDVDPGMVYLSRDTNKIISFVKKLHPTNQTFYKICRDSSALLVEASLIYEDIDPSYNHSKSLISAVESNRIGNVRVLLNDGRVDASSLNYTALKIAIKNNNEDIFKLLKWYILNRFKETDVKNDENVNNTKRQLFYQVMIEEIIQHNRINMIEFNSEKENFDIRWFPYKSLTDLFNSYNPSKQDLLDTIYYIFNLNVKNLAIEAATSASEEGLGYTLLLYRRINGDSQFPILVELLYNYSVLNIRPENILYLLSLNIPFSLNGTFKYIAHSNIETSNDNKLFIRTKEEKIEDMYKILDIVCPNKNLFNNREVIRDIISLYRIPSHVIFFERILLCIDNENILLAIISEIIRYYRPGYGEDYDDKSFVTRLLDNDLVTPDFILKLIEKEGDNLFKSINIIIATFFFKINNDDFDKIDHLSALVNTIYKGKYDSLIKQFTSYKLSGKQHLISEHIKN